MKCSCHVHILTSVVVAKVPGKFAASVCWILHVEVASTSKMLITVNSTTL